TYTPPGVGADSSCPYPYIAKSVFSHHQYTYSFHRKRISVPHFMGVYGYEGAINRPLQLLTVCK
ncbi:hypothetical protein, partial [Prevotella pallens]|uniref:hypothetical protein n=1 Tax=Prevotella pallens TaxID=60133 RepID=UPI0028D7F18B